jgi:site-specific recombinase XerD
MSTFRTFLSNFRRYSGFEFQLTPQVLRRTFGCNLVRSGEHDLIVAKLMRHTCTTFRNNYATLVETCRKASLNACVSAMDGNDDNNAPSGIKLVN